MSLNFSIYLLFFRSLFLQNLSPYSPFSLIFEEVLFDFCSSPGRAAKTALVVHYPGVTGRRCGKHFFLVGVTRKYLVVNFTMAK